MWLQGELSLPPKEKQLQDIERLQKWRRSFIPADESRSAKYQLHGNQYHDQLVSDLGHGIFRKVRSCLAAAPTPPPRRRHTAPPAHGSGGVWKRVGRRTRTQHRPHTV
jgi:hypothetical protein